MSRATHLLTHPVTLHEPTGTTRDGFGHTAREWTDQTATGYVRRNQTSDTQAGNIGTLNRTACTLYLPPDSPVAAGWEVTIDGARFAVQGVPTRPRHPRTGDADYVAVEILAVVP